MRSASIFLSILITISSFSCQSNTIKKSNHDGFEIEEILDTDGKLVSITAIKGADTLILSPVSGKQIAPDQDGTNCLENWVTCVLECEARAGVL